MRSLKLIFLFYRGHAAAGIPVSLACTYIYMVQPSPILLPFLFALKLFSFACIAFLWYQFRKHELYFYHNMGLSRPAVFIGSFIIDMFIFLFTLFLSTLYR